MRLSSGKCLAVIVLVPALALACGGWSTFVQDLAYTRVRTEVSFWGRGEYQPTVQSIILASQAIDALLETAPSHPDYLALQARHLAWRAHWSLDDSARQTLNNGAMESHREGLTSRPAHRHDWSKMVEYASRASAGEPLLRTARDRLEVLRPGET